VGNFPLFGGCQSQNLRGRVQFLGGQDDAYDPLPGRQLLSIAAKLDADHGVEIRQAKAKPIFDALEAWLHTRAAQDLESPLAAVPRYALTRMARMRPCRDHGSLGLDKSSIFMYKIRKIE
jgi:hypothetical protein